MARYYAARKRRKQSSSGPSAWLSPAISLLFAAASVWLLWIQWAGTGGGNLGTFISNILNSIFGYSAYIFPLLLIYGFYILFKNRDSKNSSGIITLTFGILVITVSLSSELALLKKLFTESPITGGAAGEMMSGLFSKIFGPIGAAIFSAAFFLIGLHILFRISWAETLQEFWTAMKEDYSSWMEARKELKEKKASAQEKEIEIKRTKAEPKDEAEEPAESPAEPVITRAQTQPEPKPAKEKAVKQPADTKNNADVPPAPGKFELPSTTLLNAPPPNTKSLGPSDEEIKKSSEKLVETLKSFGIEAAVTGVSPGPVVTRYEVKPQPGVKVSSVVSLSNDIALAMKARGIRVEAPIPGKDAIGFEIPNEAPAMVVLREILEDPSYSQKKNPLVVGLGRHAEGAPAVANLEKMPHLLVAGATNSGKSICLQSIIMSILYRSTPDMVKFLMIDPKRLELTFYDGIPHLYDPKVPCDQVTVVTQPKDAVASLQKMVKVMENRYIMFEMAKVKNIESYNKWAKENNQQPVFYIIVVIDELADLMMQTKAAVEDSIQRLAQMARAVGIHLVLCTQRPSVNVITGVIKANLPSRIAMQVASKTDSRVILDTPGAESLLGKGDMLYLAIDAQKPSRIQGAYVSEQEIQKTADFLRAQGKPNYQFQFQQEEGEAETAEGLGASSEELRQALKLILERRRVSQDLLKAHFGSSARATNLLSLLEMKGFIHKPEGSNRWEIAFDKIEHQFSVMESRRALQSAASGEVNPS